MNAPTLIDVFASALVALVGLYFLAFGTTALVSSGRAERFLLGFAGSASAHYLELLIRLLVGCAFLLRASHLLFPGLFLLFGWVLVLTTLVLLLIPWRWHRRFAQQSVPHAIRHLKLVAVAALIFGFGTLAALAGGAGFSL